MADLMPLAAAALYHGEMAGLGHNNPPPDPFDAISVAVSDVRIEVGNYMDGQPIENAAQAAEVDRLIGEVKGLMDAAEDAQARQIKPLSDQVAEIRERWYPLLADTTKRKGALVLMKKALLQAKTVWGNQENARIAAERLAAQKIADEAAAKAAQAAREAQGNIELAEQAEDLIHDAQAALKDVKAIEQSTVKGLRDNWLVKGFVPVEQNGKTIRGEVALIRHYLDVRPDDLFAIVLQMAQADVRSGKRTLPGVEIVNERRAY